MKIVVIVQARTGSSRLPGKVLMDVCGEPILAAMLRRVRGAKTHFDLAVATTWDRADDPIAELCRSVDVEVYRGHPTDLLDRHFRVAVDRAAEAVVKIPSDCPLIDPAVVDRVLDAFSRAAGEGSRPYDYVSNLHPATYPDGNDVEVMRMGALEEAFREAERPFEREHTTPFLWERPARFRIGNVTWESGLDHSMTHRFTLDYEEDYRFVRRVFEELGGTKRLFTIDEILALLAAKPEIYEINRRYAGVNWYRHHLAELTQVTAAETRLEADA